MYQITEGSKFCNYTYVNEKDLGVDEKTGDPKKLLKCSKCKEVYYVDQTAQRADWKRHKKVCCALEADPDRAKMQEPLDRVEQCVDQLRFLLCEPFQRFKGRYFVYLMQQLKRLCMADFRLIRNPAEFLELMGEMVLRVLYHQVNQFGNNFLDLLFAIPGFTNYILSDSIFLNTAIEELRASQKAVSDFQIEYGSAIFEATLGFSDLVATLLYTAAIKNVDDEPYIYDTPLAAAIIRRMMQSWQCRYVRASFPDNNVMYSQTRLGVSRSSIFFLLFHTSLTSGENRTLKACTRKDELVPGMTLKQLMVVLTEDSDIYGNLSHTSRKKLFAALDWEHRDQTRGPWSLLTPRERINFLNDADSLEKRLIARIEKADDDFQIPFGEPLEIKNELTWLLMSNQSSIFLKMYQELDMKKDLPSYAAFRLRMMYDHHNLRAGWRTKWYLEEIEPRYEKEMERLGMDPLPFPEDVAGLIKHYCFPKKTWDFRDFGYD